MNLAHGGTPDARPGKIAQGAPESFTWFYSLRRKQGNRDHRPERRAGTPGAGAQAENDRGRRQRLLAHPRFPAHGKDCQRRWCVIFCGHGSHRRPGRRRSASQPGAPRRLRFHHHAQDPARTARRIGAVQGAIRQGNRSHHFSRHAGWTADAHHRRKGRLPEGSRRAGIPQVRITNCGQRAKSWPPKSPRRVSASSAAARTIISS